MDEKFDKNNGLLIFVHIMISVLCVEAVNLCNALSSFDMWVTPVSWIVMVHSICSIVLIKKRGYKMASFPLMFLYCTLVFNYGQLILLGIFKSYKFYKSWNKWEIYPEDVYEKTVIIVMLAVSFYVFGVLISKRNIQMRKNNDDEKKVSEVDCRSIGVIILVITLPFNIYEAVLLIRASIISGYSGTREVGINNFVTVIGWLSVIGAILIIESAKSDKRRKRLFLSFLIIYSLEMISGNRGNSMCAIITMIVFYFNGSENKDKIKIGKSFLYFGAGVIILSLISTIKDYRGLSDKGIISFFNSLVDHIGNNILFENIEEFGGTVAVISIAQIYLNSTGGWLYGKTYITGILSVVPNFAHGINEIINSGNIARIMQEYGIYGRYQNIGSNYIAELYMNFGYFSMAVFLIIGIITAYVQSRIVNKNDLIKSAYYTMPVLALIQWTRWSFSSTIRLIAWGAMLIFVVTNLSIGKRKKC